jgi:hypothetical protein
VALVVAIVRRDQRAPGVRADLAVGEQVVGALEAFDLAAGAGTEDAVSRHAQQLLQLDHQMTGASGMQDVARHGVPLSGMRRPGDDQRRGRKAEACERAKRPPERVSKKLTHGTLHPF